MPKPTPPPPRQKRGFPSSFKRKSPLEKDVWLNSAECKAHVEAGHLQYNQIEAKRRELLKSAARVSRIAPSLALYDDFRNGAAFPPVPDHDYLRMRVAQYMLSLSEEPVLWPANYLSRDGATYDRVLLETQELAASIDLIGGGSGAITMEGNAGAFTTSSPTTIATERIEEMGAVAPQSKLPPEDKASLMAEIVEQGFTADGRKWTRMKGWP